MARELVDQGRREAVAATTPPEKKKVSADRAPFVIAALLKGLNDQRLADFVSMRINMSPKDANFDPAYAELRAALNQPAAPTAAKPKRDLPPAAAALAARAGISRSEPVPSGNLRDRMMAALPLLSDDSFDVIRNELGNSLGRAAKRTG